MTGAPQHRVVMVDGVPMSALVAVAPEPKAVIVAIHGGATTSAYFDCPGHPRLSLLRAAAERGYTAIGLDRPGYGASALYADEFTDAEQRVRFAYGVVDRILADGPRGAGVLLMGHSAGCELALRMATVGGADNPTTVGRTVVGVELAGTGLRYHQDARAVIKQATYTSRPGLRDLLWQPTSLYPPEVLTSGLSAPGVAYEMEVTTHWAKRDLPALAAQVTAPVQFSVADHEAVWESTPDAVAAIAALFTAARSVRVNEVDHAGHNISVGLSADVYHRRVLEFADECTAHEELEAG
jgi:pimeloyl-ACP methyl ester carboxylesterase